MNEEQKHTADDRKINRLIDYIRRQHRRFNQKKLVSRLLFSISTVLLVLCLMIWIEQQQYFTSAAKTLFWSGALVLALLSFFLSRRSFSADSFSSFYSRISDAVGLPSLKHAFDLALYSRDSGLKLYQTALNRNIKDIPWDTLRPGIKAYIRDLPATKLFRISLGAAAISLGLFIFSGLLHTDALLRSSRFWDEYQKPNPYSFTLIPGNTTIEQGSSFQPEISFDGDLPDELLLGVKTEVEEEFRFRPLQQAGSGTFAPDPFNLSSDATYFVRMDEFRSPQYSVKVQLRPRFESLTVTLFPPEYTRLDSSRFTYPFSQIKAYRGSRIEIGGQTNKPVSQLRLISLASGDTLSPAAGARDSSRFTFRRSVSSSDTLLFEMEDPSGLTNNNTFKFTVDPIHDEYPFVQIIEPESNVQQSTPSPLEITFEASDDFGITSTSLHYELNRAFVQQPETGSIELDHPAMNASESYRWDLTDLNPKPRDVITFWLEVTDNDGYSGYKSSTSRKLTVTLPSLVENLDEIGEKESDVQETLEDISESHEEMKKEYERFKENLKQNPETNWEQKQMLDEVRQKQEEIDKQVEELNKKFEEIRKEINQNDMISEETRQAYEELQKLIDEIDDPALKQALEELQKALGNLNQQQLRQALEEFEFNEEVYKERLQRTIELFKTLKLNSDLEKMATALEDLAEKEGELSESDSPPENQAKQQEAIQKDTENLSEQMEKLNENATQRSGEDVNKLQEQGQQSLESIRKQLQENIERLRQQNSGDQSRDGNQNQDNNDDNDTGENQRSPQQQQRQIQQQFQQLAQTMRQAKQQFQQQRMQVNMTALQNILYNLVNLSEEQEELTRSTEHLANRSQAFVDKARIEKNISNQFSRVSDSLFAVSSQIPSFSNRINNKKKEVERNLEQAVEQMAERNKSQSTYAGRQSLGGINDLASMVASLMDQLQNQAQSGMGGGMSMQQFMEQLQNMSGSQQRLNQQIQNLINDIQGDRLSRDQIDRLNQMARQQNQIRKQLRELQQRGGLESGDRILSELERMAQEMEETINDLRGGETDRLLIERQQNILSRMLNAEKAIQERDKKEEREGTAAEDAPRSVPPDITLEELQKKIRNLLNDPEHTRYSDDYQRLIEQYFELLKQLRENEVGT